MNRPAGGAATGATTGAATETAATAEGTPVRGIAR